MSHASSAEPTIDDVAVVAWPRERERRTASRRAGLPCLLLVDDGQPPPRCSPLEDWSFRGARPGDIAHRRRMLARRAAAPEAFAALPPRTLAIVRVLLAGRPPLPIATARAAYAAADGGTSAASFRAELSRTRRRLAVMGWRVDTLDDGSLLMSPDEGCMSSR